MKADPQVEIEVLGEVIETEASVVDGNAKSNALKRLGAQYMQWATAAEFKEECQDYFDECDRKYADAMYEWNALQVRSEHKAKLPLPAPTPYTHIGLALHLGLLRRSDLSIVGGRGEDFLRVQAWVNAKIEEQLTTAVLQDSKHGLSREGSLTILRHVLPWSAADGAEDVREEQQQVRVAESSRPQIAVFTNADSVKAFLAERKADQQKAIGK